MGKGILEWKKSFKNLIEIFTPDVALIQLGILSARTSLAQAGNRTRIKVEEQKFFLTAGRFFDGVVVSSLV